MDNAPPVRIILAEQDDLVHYGLRQYLKEANFDGNMLSFHNFSELRTGLAFIRQQPKMLHEFTDVLLLGKCATRIPTNLLCLLTNVVQLTTIPLLLLGDTTEGWVINHLIEEFPTVRAYLHRHDRLQDVLLTAIDHVKREHTYLSPTATMYMMESQKTRLNKHTFGPEEHHVLQALAQDANEADIAKQLRISKRRVYSITNRLRYLFGVSTNEAMIIRAHECGMC